MLGGELIHQTSDEYGSIEVVDYMQKIRGLHFGNKTQQSASLLCNPYFLIHKYAQAMTLPICRLKVKRVLVIGLGAGSIVKYLYNYFPHLVIDAVELRPKVTEVAIDYFMLPEPNDRFHIYHEAADIWLNKENTTTYDLIIVDTFLTSKTGKDITVDHSASLTNISNKLTENGVAAFNYLGDNLSLYPGLDTLKSICTSPIHHINIESTNEIILASHSEEFLKVNDADFKRISNITTVPYEQYFELLQPVT